MPDRSEVSVREVLALLCLYALCACSQTGTARHDGGLPEQNPASDAGEDGPANVATLLRERDRGIRFVCVCQAEAGLFESFDDCVTKTGYNPSLIDCLSAAFVPFDSPALREQLACELQVERARSACLESATCTEIATTACSDMLPQCPMVDPQLLTQILLSCPGAAVLSR